jgi:hypothetical protein
MQEPTRWKQQGEPQYGAVYELESPSVLLSKAWAEGVDQGHWPREVSRSHYPSRLLWRARQVTGTC